jgi:hypothetical protein
MLMVGVVVAMGWENAERLSGAGRFNYQSLGQDDKAYSAGKMDNFASRWPKAKNPGNKAPPIRTLGLFGDIPVVKLAAKVYLVHS